jgi:hypothetical protein
MSFLLEDEASRCHDLTVADVSNPKLYEVASSKFAVDCQVEECQFPASVRHLQTDADRPNLFELERCLLSNKLALVPGLAGNG